MIDIKFKSSYLWKGGRRWDGETLLSTCNVQAMLLVLKLADGFTGEPL